MLKFLIILILIGYLFYRVTSFIFSGFFRGFTREQSFGPNNTHTSRQSRRAPDSNLNIDTMPNEQSNKSGGYGGGEYVDYEEIK